jgi:hypothetical protein
MSRTEYPSELVRQAIREERLLATIAELRAEVAALRDRPAMPWRKREDCVWYEGDRFLAAVHVTTRCFGVESSHWDYACVTTDATGHLWILDDEGDWGWEFSDVDFVIPWSDLMPPGGGDGV